MANTTNFNWETPDDTDLVKDGAAAIRTLAGAIDTSLVDLKGGTTGQVLAKNSNTDMDFVWSADASGIPATIFDAKGDIIAASAADTAARLAVGANDTVLTADSSTATGLKWATVASGGMTLLSTTTVSTATTTISIAGGYTDIVIYFSNIRTQGFGHGLEIRYNTVDTKYNSVYLYQNSSGASVQNVHNASGVGTWGITLTDATNKYMFGYLKFFDYLHTSGWKSYEGQIAFPDDNEVYNFRKFFGANDSSPAAITQVQFITTATSLNDGTIRVYGVK